VNPLPIEGLVKTVPASQVERETSYGWVVVGSYQDTISKRHDELADAPAGTFGHGIYTDHNGHSQCVPNGKMLVPRYFAETLTYFVLRKDTESAITALREQLDKAAVDASKAKNDAQKEYGVLLKSFEEMKSNLQKTEAALQKALKDNETAAKMSSQEVEESFRKKVGDLERDRDRLKREMEELRRRHGVRVVDMSEDAE